MKLEEKSILGIWKYKNSANYEPGDFVVHGENIYKVLEDVPATNEKIDLEKDGRFQLYPGEMITSKEQYDKIIEEGGAGDKYVSGQALNEILKATYFGLDSDGIITDTTDILPNGEIRTIDGNVLDSNDDSGVLDKLLVAEGYNNGMIKVGRETDQIKSLVGSAAYDEVVPKNGEWWIKVDTTKCQKCWECVKCGKGYIRKTKGTDEDPAGELVIYPGEGTNFTEDRLGGKEPEDIKDASRFVEAVNICPYRALGYINNEGDNVATLRIELREWEQADRDNTRAKKDIIIYGTTGNIYSSDPTVEYEINPTSSENVYLVCLNLPASNSFIRQEFINIANYDTRLSGSLRSDWLNFINNDSDFYTPLVASGRDIHTVNDRYWTSDKTTKWIPEGVAKIKEETTGRGVEIEGTRLALKYIDTEESFTSKEFYKEFPTTHQRNNWYIIAKFHKSKYNDEDMINFTQEINSIIDYNKGGGHTSSAYNLYLTESWSGTSSGIAGQKLNWYYKTYDQYEFLPKYFIGYTCAGVAAVDIYASVWDYSKQSSTLDDGLKEIKTYNIINNKVNKVCEYIRMLKTLGGDIQLSDVNPSEEDVLYPKADMPDPDYKWNDYDPDIYDLYGMYKCWWDLNNYSVQDYYKEGDDFPSGDMKDVWLNNSDRIHSLDRLSCNRLCVKLGSGIEKIASISNYSREETKSLLNRAYKTFLMSGIGNTEEEADDIIERGEYSYLLTGDEENKTEALNGILHDLGAKSDYVFDIYPFYEPSDIITYHSDITGFYNPDIVGFFSDDRLRYNNDNGKIIWYQYNSIGNANESSQGIDNPGGGVFSSIFDIITHIVTNTASGASFYYVYKHRDDLGSKYVYSLLSPYGFYRYIFGDSLVMTPSLSMEDIGNFSSSNYGPIIPSIECRIAYNEWLYVIDSLKGMVNSSDPTNKNVAEECRIKLIPSPSSIKAYTSDERYNGKLDDSVVYDSSYYEKHYYTGTTDPWVILKQYSYYNDGTLNRIQEIIDPRLGGVFFRSSGDPSWVPLISSYERNNWDLVRKLRRANEIVSGIESRNSVVYASPSFSSDKWNYVGASQEAGSYYRVVNIRPKGLKITYRTTGENQDDTATVDLPSDLSEEKLVQGLFTVYPSGAIEYSNSINVIEIEPIYE